MQNASDNFTALLLRTPSRRSGCPISLALDLLGDQWSLLVVRDLMFKGLRRFGEFQNAGEGIATNVLADRLERLEQADIISKSPDPEDGRRSIYSLTRKGLDLAPALIELVLWSDAYGQTDAPRAEIRAMRTNRARYLADVRKKHLPGLGRKR